MSEIAMLGKVRGLNVDQLEETGKKEQLALSGQGEKLMALGAPNQQEEVRRGRSFWVANAIGSPLAAVTAIPTTGYNLAIYNNEPDGGRSYNIDYVWAHFVVIPAALVHAGIIGCLGQVRETAPTIAKSVGVIKSRCGMGKLDTLCRAPVASDIVLPATTGYAANWFPIGDSVNTAVVSLPGLAQYVPVEGRIIVPPGRFFAVHVLASVTTATSILGIGWTEKQLLLG